jgi:hypothetical protein
MVEYCQRDYNARLHMIVPGWLSPSSPPHICLIDCTRFETHLLCILVSSRLLCYNPSWLLVYLRSGGKHQ